MEYTRTGTTYFVTPKADARDRIAVEVGDSKQAEFLPQVKVQRWDNEVNLSVRLKHDEAAPTVRRVGEEVRWRGDRKGVDFYEITPNAEHPEGGTEVDVLLYERPANDRVEFTLNTKGLRFAYQPPLTAEEIERGMRRSERIVGSWAVYAAESKTNFVGGKLYRSGKVGHIYNSLMIDAEGKTARTNPQIVDNGDGTGTLTVNLDKDFLDSAVYPIRHAAGLTFGYTSAGASDIAMYQNRVVYAGATPASGGLAVDFNAYGYNEVGVSKDTKFALWKASDDQLVANSILTKTINSDTPQWWVGTYGTQPVLTAQQYALGTISNDTTNFNRWMYDSVVSTGGQHLFNNYTTPTALGGFSLDQDYKMSYYVTYTPVGGPPPRNRMQQYLVR